MAHETMHLAVPRINNDMLEMQLGGSDSLPRKYHKQKHSKSFPEVHRVPSLAWRSSDDRCPVVTFLTFEPNGHWRVVTVPLHFSDSENLVSGSQVSMECLHLVPRPIRSTQADRQNVANNTLIGSAVHTKSQNNKASNRNALKELPKHLLCKPFTSTKSSSPSPDSSTTIKPLPLLTNDSTVDSVTKKSSGKKNKKKTKRGKKNPCRTGSTEPVVSLKDHLHVGSIFGTCDGNDVDHKEAPRACVSRGRDVEMSERARPVLGKGVTPQARGSEAAILNSPVHDMSQSAVLIGPNSNHGTKSCHSSKRWEKENAKADFSGPLASSSRKVSSSYRNLSISTVESCNNVDKVSHAHQGSNIKDLHLATHNRSFVQSQIFSQCPNSNGYRSVGNYRGPTGKESTRAVWQKVQRNSANDNAGDSNGVPTPSQLDVPADSAYSLKRKSYQFEHAKKLKDIVCSEWRTKGEFASKEGCKFSSESGSDTETVTSDSARVTAPPSETRYSISPPRERVCSKPSGSMSQIIGCPNHSLAKSSSSLDQSKMAQVQSPEVVPNLFGNSVRQALESIYLADPGEQDHNSGCGTQKWIPIGLKDLGLTISSDSSLAEHSDDPAAENSVKNNEKRESQYLVPKSEESVRQTAGDVLQSRTPQSADQQASMLEGHTNKTNTENGAPDKIAEAVNQAYKLQLESEAIEKASGCPVAEFERLLQKSSPVICQPSHSICNECPRDHFSGMSLCKHEKPNVPLSSIWKWYEELGVCGLEVNGDDYENAKRFSVDFVSFSAYFVPYLSAVQLFRNSPDQLGRNLTNNTSSSEAELESFSSQLNRVCSSELSPVMSNDPELLYEYFESEPPQQRRPLYEKIQQLVIGDGLPQYQGQGDPTNLDRVKLNELHHKSWYSVAWYPIYRIPEGNFRAAFLTFHSLGHFTCQSSRLDSISVQNCIVCPAVGLQSYNAQSECWFSPRSSTPSDKKSTAPEINRREILKERVRTLEETASVMARAVVKKGNTISANWHPDYEFFCSRKRFFDR